MIYGHYLIVLECGCCKCLFSQNQMCRWHSKIYLSNRPSTTLCVISYIQNMFFRAWTKHMYFIYTIQAKILWVSEEEQETAPVCKKKISHRHCDVTVHFWWHKVNCVIFSLSSQSWSTLLWICEKKLVSVEQFSTGSTLAFLQFFTDNE